jgi:hypothetical protein
MVSIYGLVTVARGPNREPEQRGNFAIRMICL